MHKNATSDDGQRQARQHMRCRCIQAVIDCVSEVIDRPDSANAEPCDQAPLPAGGRKPRTGRGRKGTDDQQQKRGKPNRMTRYIRAGEH